jgi:lysophospholipase
MVLTAPLIALGGVDYSMGTGSIIVRILNIASFGSMYVPKTDTSIVESRPFVGNILTSDPVRYARNAAILEAEPALALGAPTVAWADAAFRTMRRLREHSYPARIRQPILIVAGGNDAVVSNAAIEDFASLLRAGSHLVVVGAQHELLMEQDRFRSQFWAAFDAFVPGTALY